MNKVFLSHSSQDKDYVSYIANRFGKDKCVYDAMCFEAGMKNLDEIFREMGKTGIFVVFLSEHSLQSKWVKKELSIAEEKYNSQQLAQIFPIIIDPSIRYNDHRIPKYMRVGFGSYNIATITSNIVAYRKIKTQLNRYIYENNFISQQNEDCFYGRNEEITNFKKKFDLGDGIKVLVASGFMGMGRSSYLLQCLKQSEIIDKYYTPPTISLNEFASIEDLIVKFSEVGFGDYSLEKVTALPSMDEKIEALVSILKLIQNFKEQVMIYDNGCLVNRQGDLPYWFERALAAIRNEATIIIASKYNVNIYTQKRIPYLFSQPISALPYSEWMGLMRVYAQNCNLDLSLEDRSYFKDILTGYPPQVIYCVDQMKTNTVEEVKKHPKKIIDVFSPRVTELLESAFPKEIKDDAYGLLAFTSSYGVVPWDLLEAVLEKEKKYKEAFSLFKSLTICRHLGINNEYVETNPVISDYIQRSRIKLPDSIQQVLKDRLNAFNNAIKTTENSITEDFEDLKYYLKQNILDGKEIPERFMYSTLYLSSIYELYNHQRYKQIISLVEKLKDIGSFDRYDQPIQLRMQEFYCRSLARETDPKFYSEVEFFKQTHDINRVAEYNFLRGFMCRNDSEYGKALEWYNKVLEKQPRHKSAMREIVIVYKGLEDYDSAYEYAKINYLQDPDNPYQIQPYFEILVRKPSMNRTDQEDQYIHEMLQTIERIHSAKPSTTYFELKGQYAIYVEKDYARARALLNEGARRYPESSYIIRSLFDCHEVFRNLQGMEDALNRMEPLTKNNNAAYVAYKIRTAIYDAYAKKPLNFIYNCIDGIEGINIETKERLKKKVGRIQATM